jgi:hypothetical protein
MRRDAERFGLVQLPARRAAPPMETRRDGAPDNNPAATADAAGTGIAATAGTTDSTAAGADNATAAADTNAGTAANAAAANAGTAANAAAANAGANADDAEDTRDYDDNRAAPPAFDDDGPAWPDDADESAFLAEAAGAGGTTLGAPRDTGDADETDDANLPPLETLKARIPRETHELLEELFRARFVAVKKIPRQALKTG